MTQPGELANQRIEAISWTVGRSYQHEEGSHINITEIKEVGAEVLERAEQDLLASSIVNLVESRVTTGAWATGRSSSMHLNRELGALIGLQVLGGRTLLNLWGASARNPADDPSPGAPLRARAASRPAFVTASLSPV